MKNLQQLNISDWALQNLFSKYDLKASVIIDLQIEKIISKSPTNNGCQNTN